MALDSILPLASGGRWRERKREYGKDKRKKKETESEIEKEQCVKKKSSILLKKPIQEDNIIVSTYVPNIEAAKYIKQTLTDIKGKTDINTIRVGDFKTPLTSMN